MLAYAACRRWPRRVFLMSSIIRACLLVLPVRVNGEQSSNADRPELGGPSSGPGRNVRLPMGLAFAGEPLVRGPAAAHVGHHADPFCGPRSRPTRGLAEEGQPEGRRHRGAARRLVAPNCNPARIKWSVPPDERAPRFSALLTSPRARSISISPAVPAAGRQVNSRPDAVTERSDAETAVSGRDPLPSRSLLDYAAVQRPPSSDPIPRCDALPGSPASTCNHPQCVRVAILNSLVTACPCGRSPGTRAHFAACH